MIADRPGSERPNNDNVASPGDAAIAHDMPLTIGNLSRMVGVSRLRLISYEMRGLIKRHRCLDQGWVYRWEDCARVVLIVKARRAGVTVRELAPLIRATRSGASPAAIRYAWVNCLALIGRLDRRHQALRHALAEIRLLYDQLSERLPASDIADGAGHYGDPDSG